jgi:hypothetical protein
MPIPSSAAAFGDSDIPALMADMAIAITVGGVAGVGLLDEADEILVQDSERGEVVVLATTLTVQTSAFPAAAIDQSVAIGSLNFTVRSRLRIGDGGLTKLVLGSDDGGGGGGSVNFADDIVPAGAIDGVNTVYTLPNAPNPPTSLKLFNGERLSPGVDFTLVGNTITFVLAPSPGANLIADYRF